MSKLGELLASERKGKNISYDAVTEKTRISEEILIKLEEGDFKGLPSYVHAKNFVNSYASFLRLDKELVGQLFNEECAKESFDREIHYVTSPVTHEPVERKSPLGFVIGFIIVLVAVVAGVYFFLSMKNNGEIKLGSEKQIESAAPAVSSDSEPEKILDVASASAGTATEGNVVASPEEVKPESAAPAVQASVPVRNQDSDSANASESGVHTATLVFSDVCWVNIEVDNSTVYDFIAEKGVERTVDYNEFFLLNLGNAAVASVQDSTATYRGFGEYKKPIKNLRFSKDSHGKLIYQKLK
jgi:cytoskeletal protein RodZ